MGKKKKETRIKEEEDRLRALYNDMPIDAMSLLEGLIQRAAYMRITLEDYEKDLDEKGYIETFTQSEKTKPYERERPVARLYNTMNKNYQSIMKQLANYLPKYIRDDFGDDDSAEINAFIKQ
jgi:predicted metal-dependent phosphoesterase TrpH